MMTNLIALAILCLAASVHGFSKYGRSCRDIGCLGSEVCILAEDPCTIGHSSDCGTYPTCKKKSLVDGGGTNAEPARPAAPSHPVYPSPPRQDDVPNYPPPPPPRSNYPSVPAYGSNSGGYGGSNGGYGGNSGGYGSNTGGYGGSSGYGGSNGGYGGSNGRYGSDGGNTGNRGSLPSSGGDNPFSSFFNGLSGGGGANGAGASKPNGGGFVSSFLNNALNNFTRNGGLSGLSGLLSPSNTRPIVENPYYQNPNQRAGGNYPNNPSYPGYPGNNGVYQQHGGYNPSYSQPGSQQTGYVAKNYGKSQSARSGATTRKPASYGWNLGMSLVCLMAVIGATQH